MGSADKQGKLWGTAVADWAEINEQHHIPYWEAMLNDVEEPTYKQFRQWIEFMARNWEEQHKIYEAIMQAQLTNPAVAKNNYRIVSGILEPYLSRFKGRKKKEANLRLENYVLDFIPDCIDRVLHACKSAHHVQRGAHHV